MFTTDNFIKHLRVIIWAVVLVLLAIAWLALPVHRIDLTVQVKGETAFNLPQPDSDEPLVLKFGEVAASEARILNVDVVNYGREAIDEESWGLKLAGPCEAIALLNRDDLPAAVVQKVSHDAHDQINLSLGVVNPKKRLPLALLLINPVDNSASDLKLSLSKEIAGLSDPELMKGSLVCRYFPRSFSVIAVLSFILIAIFLASLVLKRPDDSPSERWTGCLLSVMVSIAACLIVGAILGAGVAFGGALYYGGWAAL